MAQIEQKNSAAKGSSKKLILIIAAVLISLAGGSAATFFFLKGSLAEAEKTEQVVVEEKLYFDMEKPFIVDFPKSASARLIQISVSFLVEGEETVAALKKHEPMLRNNLLMLISAQNVDELKTRDGKEHLRAVMLNETDTVLKKMAGQSRLKEVFFTSFVMQ
ncbi:MAG: flagellar basal body-associated FliL family protein [Methylobacter sp.]|uniref:flagellar basal body-associated FliL family protein n=1 Tax=Methylobacter sp. TaxID=2051955 RepID=UPI00258B4FCF|nr:flagellar basal body-associated FliL family protein [Methylobacter sp.]MCL7420527.1 flagellar basal body-associated FliL family protein [Methylobacter sp.]